jgi:hypothetical protein
MELFHTIIRWLAWLSILFAIAEVYLKANKLWKRKHEKAVAESQSIMAESLSIISGLPLLILYTMEHSWESFFEQAIWLPINFLVILIGAGFWIRGERAKGLWALILSSLKAERAEVGDLAKAFFKPAGSEKIIEILSRVAMIDEVLDEREKNFIETFARTWGIPFSIDDIAKYKTEGEKWSFIALRDCIIDYLSISPPIEQVAQLRDTIQALVNIDEEVSPEEALISSEVNGILMHYVGEGEDSIMFEVYIAPQSEEKEKLVKQFLPNAERKRSAGGYGFLVDSFYSEEYAEIICNKYREFELLTFVIKKVPGEHHEE